MDRDTHDKLMKKEASKIEKKYTNIVMLSDKQKQVYRIIAHNPGITSRELCLMLSVTRSTMFEKLTRLVDSGYIIAKTLDVHGTKSYKIDKRRRVLL
jgi:DNA-binding MarR family transcriptional regulator